MILAVIIKTFVLYCIVFVFLQILTICIHACSPLCGRFKGADRAIYAVEPCGQGKICNSYITGTRSVSDLLHWSPRAEGPRASCNKSDADRVAVI